MKVLYFISLMLCCPLWLWGQQTASDAKTNLRDNSKEIFVVSHRGDWRNAPENSLQAIQNCIQGKRI